MFSMNIFNELWNFHQNPVLCHHIILVFNVNHKFALLKMVNRMFLKSFTFSSIHFS